MLRTLTASIFGKILAAACDWHLRGDYRVAFKKDGDGEIKGFSVLCVHTNVYLHDKTTGELAACEDKEQFVDYCIFVCIFPDSRHLCCFRVLHTSAAAHKKVFCFFPNREADDSTSGDIIYAVIYYKL